MGPSPHHIFFFFSLAGGDTVAQSLDHHKCEVSAQYESIETDWFVGQCVSVVLVALHGAGGVQLYVQVSGFEKNCFLWLLWLAEFVIFSSIGSLRSSLVGREGEIFSGKIR